MNNACDDDDDDDDAAAADGGVPVVETATVTTVVRRNDAAAAAVGGRASDPSASRIDFGVNAGASGGCASMSSSSSWLCGSCLTNSGNFECDDCDPKAESAVSVDVHEYDKCAKHIIFH